MKHHRPSTSLQMAIRGDGKKADIKGRAQVREIGTVPAAGILQTVALKPAHELKCLAVHHT